ncbi:MAG TPA: PIN domain-containing protein [Phycisphaerae bacterium]|nr:PIN domain-containing protein [Phycisphaerae bacterium]
MLLTIIRFLFVLIIAGVAMNYAEFYQPGLAFPIFMVTLGLACLVIAGDVFIPQKSLLAISGLFFGLVVGMVIAFGIGQIVNLLMDAYRPAWRDDELLRQTISTTKLVIGIIACYLAVSFVLQTKDDVRFVIPYVEFSKQRKGQHPMILDTSVIIDGRIADVLAAWAVDAPVIIPRFILHELQAVADSSDKLKRNRGRRGLDIINKLQTNEKIEIQFLDFRVADEEAEAVDHRLVTLARRIDGRVVTNDYNLNKVAKIRGVDVINVNDLANCLRPVFLPGESMQVKVIRSGEAAGQGVGYLDDGTMVVVESGRDQIGQTILVTVTSVLQTSAGRMVFGRIEGIPAPDTRRRNNSG